MTLPVTALTAAICALLLVFLAFGVVKQRIRTKTKFGAGDDDQIKMARGAHANLAEHAPLAILMLALLELANAHHWTLTGLAGLFLVSRVMHVIGMHQHVAGKNPVMRQGGVTGTWVSMAAMALWIIYLCVTVNL